MYIFKAANRGDSPSSAAKRNYKEYKATMGPKAAMDLNDFYKRYDPSIQAGKINRNVIRGKGIL
jgi:hypothetical protein